MLLGMSPRLSASPDTDAFQVVAVTALVAQGSACVMPIGTVPVASIFCVLAPTVLEMVTAAQVPS